MSSAFEGQSLAMLEALGCGLPYGGFASVEGIEETIINNENGLLVREFSPSALAAGLAKLMADAHLRRKLALGAKNSAKTFAPGRIFGQWEALLEECAALKGRTVLTRAPACREEAEARARLAELMTVELDRQQIRRNIRAGLGHIRQIYQKHRQHS